MRKYIDDLGIKKKETPQGWSGSQGRRKQWQCQRKMYGFDYRETFSLDYTFLLWAYERLMMFNEVNIIDTSYHKFEYEDKEMTLQDCIDFIINVFKYELTKDDVKNFELTMDERLLLHKRYEDSLKIFAMILPYLWW